MNSKVQLIKDVSSKPQNSQLGVIIKRVGQQQNHTGFIFVDKDEFVLAHFGWHRTYFFQKKRDSDGYAMSWFNLDQLPERTLVQIINELEQITKNHQVNAAGVFDFPAPYGILNHGGSRISDGKFYTTPNTEGDSLTCSIFVNCIFEQSGFPILDLDTWQTNEQDIEWQTKILDNLNGQLSPEFMRIQRENVGKVPRLRPEQMVGACCIFDFELVDYDSANHAAASVNEQLDILGC
ncbi:hypothetical protein F943_03224 [Acinetobacter ursingii NIPH 706]|jgi:hypothetical protein|uniref:hypothetical protein n=1 Tax=Acinetobacter ursingii TaxID=108980 RepID=UPI0002CED576|nr:hypothetical protein [Acinetobacter ursingii]EBY7415718.1 hypothetical protein [Salmonella enterica subsp. enterica serovar Alachua]ECE6725816.1 hypothetical protein [Salmonella enterica subsp. enterica serovar Paratyphi A]ENX45726.1 hypothetical protein F943_03224 [Acinetobacter ursingii NIPH 706]MCH2017274.1 hypothetical protein [Acinetobacter ursingii]MCU4524848.1 hypothetical protein [Acinetobacter ursingii]